MSAALQSHLYECRVFHARFAPRAHRFGYRIFMLAVDLDELDELPRRQRLLAINRAGLYSLRERDYLPVGEPTFPDASAPVAPAAGSTLKQRVSTLLANHGIDFADGRVLLVTLPRILGYQFNPVSFYFCFDRDQRPVAAIAEVTNTFREVKPYVLTTPEVRGDRVMFHLRTPKHFYVSPFSDVDVAFDFRLHVPDGRLAVQIDDYTGAQRTLTSSLVGPRRELTDARLLWFTFKYPLLTLRVIFLIHWHALRLWLKRVPWFAKAARAAEQRGLYRPHASIASSSHAT